VHGSPEQIAGFLRVLAGLDVDQIQVTFRSRDVHEPYDQLRIFGAEVAPQVGYAGVGRRRGTGSRAAGRPQGVLVVAGLRAGADDQDRAVGQALAHAVSPARSAATWSSTCTPRLFRANATMW
jgi:hypothetical protein